jgi:hypothetical protein
MRFVRSLDRRVIISNAMLRQQLEQPLHNSLRPVVNRDRQIDAEFSCVF